MSCFATGFVGYIPRGGQNVQQQSQMDNAAVRLFSEGPLKYFAFQRGLIA